MGWLYLLLAGVFEVGFTTAMRHFDGWKLAPQVAFLICITLSFAFLTEATKSIPIGTAYAVWTGIGAVGTLLVGIAFYSEPASIVRLALVGVVIAAIVGLKLVH